MGWTVLIDLFQIFKARKNPRLASKLASRLAHGQIIDRLTAPLLIVHIALWILIMLCAILIAISLWAGFSWHWSAIALGLLPALAGAAAIFVSLGLKRGLDKVRDTATQLSDASIDGVSNRLSQARAQNTKSHPSRLPDEDADRL